MSEDTHARHGQFDALPQQREASELGIWIFLATEILFFGALFVGYAIYRSAHPDAFAAAARETDVVLGTINTAILLTSSLAVALAVRTVTDESPRLSRIFLGSAVVLGLAFLTVKGFEYHHDLAKGLVPGAHSVLEPGPERVFIAFYWVMTAVHALHVTIGVGVLASMFGQLMKKPEIMRRTSRLEVAGLYWHFVDVVWIFLYPLLYLVGRTG